MHEPSVLFINQHYYPDHAATAQHLTDLAEFLAARGFDVHVLCSRGKYTSGALKVPRQEVHNGVSIRRINATAFRRSSHLGRVANYASFAAQVFFRLLTGPSYDCIVTLTTPPLLSVLGACVHKLRDQVYGIWSMDLHPEAELAVEMLREDQLITRTLNALDRFAHGHADFVVNLGRCMKARLREKELVEKQLVTIPVWNRRKEVYPVPDHGNPLLENLGLADKFVIMYSGNAGLAHRFEEVLAAMRTLKGHPEIYFLFVGSGLRRDEIVAYAEDHDIDNFGYLDYFPREQIKYSLSLGDIHLITLKEEFVGIVVPSKLYGIMAVGRPAVMVGPSGSEIARTIDEHDCGVVLDPTGDKPSHTADCLQETILELYRNAGKRAYLGANGRRAFLAFYEKDIACRRWERVLRKAMNDNV